MLFYYLVFFLFGLFFSFVPFFFFSTFLSSVSFVPCIFMLFKRVAKVSHFHCVFLPLKSNGMGPLNFVSGPSRNNCFLM